jgi:tol-pal system protein YbgF
MLKATHISLAVAALTIAAVGPAAVSAQSDAGGLSPLERLFGQRPQPSPRQGGPETVGQGAATDQMLRIERLEAQIRQLTGTIETLQHRNQQLESQVRGLGGGIEGQSASGSQPGLPPNTGLQTRALPPPVSNAPAIPPQAGRRPADVFDPTQNPTAPGAPRTLGRLPAGSSDPDVASILAPEPIANAPANRGAGAPLDLSTLAASGGSAVPSDPNNRQPATLSPGGLPPPPSRNVSATGAIPTSVAPSADPAKDQYDLGYGYMLRKDYALAEDTLQAFLKKYPGDRRAPDAQYWLAESMFQRQRYDAAAQVFLELSTNYGTHSKAPDALLRLGQSLAALKQKEMACATLAEVGRKYPRAASSVKQGVEREQKRVQC